MVQDPSVSSQVILVAIPDDWRAVVCSYLKQHGLLVKEASTYEQALTYIRLESVQGLVMTSEWAVPDAAMSIRGLLQESEKKVPAVILVRGGQGFYSYFDQYNALFLSSDPSHAPDDYIHIPFNLEELLQRMRIVHMID
jgi:DNA-binding response OmpR family regulator